ncbi:MAG: hypothetical protein B6244_11750 [Candidatus Cloacimonetes bacterium 4572_55]|nr:MAG: hypothetical protein B6244_11750 [Candidatus Cloacimonetes bacterium 4572_55]
MKRIAILFWFINMSPILGSGQETPIAYLPQIYCDPGDGSVLVPLMVEHVEGCNAGQFSLVYSDQIISYIDTVRTLDIGSNFFLDFNRDNPGTLFVVFASPGPLTEGVGALLEIEMLLQSDLDIGEITPLTLVDFSMGNADNVDFVTEYSGQLAVAKRGDSNQDGRITVADLARISDGIAEAASPLSHIERWASDINRDEILTMEDIELIAAIILHPSPVIRKIFRD